MKLETFQPPLLSLIWDFGTSKLGGTCLYVFKLAADTPLYSGSDLKSLVVTAAQACVRETFDIARSITIGHFRPCGTVQFTTCDLSITSINPEDGFNSIGQSDCIIVVAKFILWSTSRTERSNCYSSRSGNAHAKLK
ncbi:MAG: hypothetical protein Q9171_006072, partial [Xanthocarpia ochracea]